MAITTKHVEYPGDFDFKGIVPVLSPRMAYSLQKYGLLGNEPRRQYMEIFGYPIMFDWNEPWITFHNAAQEHEFIQELCGIIEGQVK